MQSNKKFISDPVTKHLIEVCHLQSCFIWLKGFVYFHPWLGVWKKCFFNIFLKCSINNKKSDLITENCYFYVAYKWAQFHWLRQWSSNDNMYHIRCGFPSILFFVYKSMVLIHVSKKNASRCKIKQIWSLLLPISHTDISRQ